MTPHHRSRALPLAALSALLLLCTSCASKSGPTPSRTLDRITETGEIRVGTSGEQPPLSMTARNGELLGLDIALARVLARSMGVEARFVKLPFSQLLDALLAGDVDLVMSGMTITPQRSRRATFVGPYYTSGKSLLTKSERVAAIEIPQDLDAPELRLAALAGSTSEAFLRSSAPRAQLVFTESLEEAVRKVRNDEVDALVADRETCSFAVLRRPDAGLIAPENVFSLEPMGIALPPDDARLAGLIQAYLDALREGGALEKATRIWFKDPSWVKQLR
ncbi:MAG: transporter substrate-binding domain-containing protein [Deltaproteobacteria bacterium]|nr:MAG: transporter substrate-binding domain-containing protein [Deltaproteobacteria bacterium]